MNDPNAEDFEITPFFNVTPDWVCIASKEGFWKRINKAIPLALEYSPEELQSKPIASFIHPDDMELTKREREKLLAGKPLINFENRYVSRSGKVIWLHWTSIYVADREVVFAIAKDITERKKIEKEIESNYQKFKGLASHFKSVLEKDRESLALELHEELAQIAAVVKMDIDSLATHLPQLPAGTQSRLDHALAASDLLIRTIRRITFSISPDLSANFGLHESLRWLCKEFSILHQVPCRFESADDESMLTLEIKMDFFRICQEILNNAIAHAHARSITIGIADMGDHLRLSIKDSGTGFDRQAVKFNSALSAIKERISSVNGVLSVQTDHGEVSVSIDVPKDSLEKK